MSLVDTAFEPRAHLFLGKYQSSTVGVVNDGEFFKTKEVVDDVDVSEGMSDIASAVTEDRDFPNFQVEEFFWDAARVHACYWRCQVSAIGLMRRSCRKSAYRSVFWEGFPC